MSRILLTAIIKDDTEIVHFERMLKSFMPYVHGLAVLLTGTSQKFDKCIELIKKYKGYHIIASPEKNPTLYSFDENGVFFSHFANARTLIFEFADTLAGYDWYTWADADDMLLNGRELQNVADLGVKSNLDMIFFTYWYSIRIRKDGVFDENDVQIDHVRERLLRPHVFKWISRLHEVAVPIDGNYKPRSSNYAYDRMKKQTLVWAHVTEKERSYKSVGRNTRILELQVKEEEGKDPRTLFYLAKTYYDLNTNVGYQKAKILIEKYLTMSGWPEERSNAWEHLGNIEGIAGDHKQAIECYLSAVREYPYRHMPYLLLAKEYMELNMMEYANFYIDMVGRMDPPTSRTTIGNPMEIKYLLVSLKYNKFIKEQNLEESIFWMKKRLEYVDTEVDRGMLKTLEEAKKLNDAAKGVLNYALWLKQNKHENRIPKLIESLPYELGHEPFAYAILNDVTQGKKWPDKSIVYFASWGGEHFEQWSPKNMDSGIGGSETAVIELAKRWVKMGYKVTVYGDPREDEGTYEGVTYLPWYYLNWKDEFNTLILWRAPFLLDRDIKAKTILYDAHDIESNTNWTPMRVKKITKVMFKSKFHRSMVPNLPDDKVAVISNGISI